jgi:hypothetical protein
MKKWLCATGLCALFVILYATTSFACGNKFLVKGRHVKKAQCFVMDKPGAILIYRDANIKATQKGLDKKMQSRLSKAGHEVRVVENLEEFESAIKTDAFDVILLGYSAADEVEKALNETGKKAKIVPVVDKKNKTEIASAKQRYGNIIKDRDRTSTKILTVNAVLSAADNT